MTINGFTLDPIIDVQMQTGDASGRKWRATYTPNLIEDVKEVSFWLTRWKILPETL